VTAETIYYAPDLAAVFELAKGAEIALEGPAATGGHSNEACIASIGTASCAAGHALACSRRRWRAQILSATGWLGLAVIAASLLQLGDSPSVHEARVH